MSFSFSDVEGTHQVPYELKDTGLIDSSESKLINFGLRKTPPYLRALQGE